MLLISCIQENFDNFIEKDITQVSKIVFPRMSCGAFNLSPFTPYNHILKILQKGWKLVYYCLTGEMNSCKMKILLSDFKNICCRVGTIMEKLDRRASVNCSFCHINDLN